MNIRKLLNKALKPMVTLIAAIGILVLGLVTIPALILVASGIADIYFGITPLNSIPSVALMIIAIVTWTTFGSPFKFLTAKLTTDRNIFQSIQRSVQRKLRITPEPATRPYSRTVEINFFESSRRIAILRRAAFPEAQKRRSVFDKEGTHGADGAEKESASFSASAG